VAVRLYLPEGEAADAVDELLAQAVLAEEVGFDGVAFGEHHAGFASYVPSPTLAAAWVLDATARIWSGAMPALLPLRPANLLVEEVAWLGRRHPGRVALGVAPGSLAVDFEVAEVPFEERYRRFAGALPGVVSTLSGQEPGALGGDAAVAACGADPIPVVVAAQTPAAVRRAAEAGAGVLLDLLSDPDRLAALSEEYRRAGGPGPLALIRHVRIGAPAEELDRRQYDLYRSYSAGNVQASWTSDQELILRDPSELADQLAGLVRRLDLDALDLKISVPGQPSADVREQIDVIGREVLPDLRARAWA